MSRINPTKSQELYSDYLKSKHWEDFKNMIYSLYPYCFYCKTKKYLNIHHLTYENRGNEQVEDVIVLCKLHHLMLHRKLLTLSDIEFTMDTRTVYKKLSLRKKLHSLTVIDGSLISTVD